MSVPTRRRFLQVCVGALALSRVALRLPSAFAAPPTDVGARTLVVIELTGGHDGYSMVIPYANDAYYRRRPTVAHAADDVIPIDPRFGWHPNLTRLSRRPMAVVDGVGAANTVNSHEMLHRWWQGDTDGLHPESTGFLGRLCDVVGDPTAPAAGVCIGAGPSPALTARTVTTRVVAPGGGTSFTGSWEHGAGTVAPSTRVYPPSRLDTQLATAVQVIRANLAELDRARSRRSARLTRRHGRALRGAGVVPRSPTGRRAPERSDAGAGRRGRVRSLDRTESR